MAITTLGLKNPLGPHFYSEVDPAGLTEPELVRTDPLVASLLDLTADDLESDQFLQVFSGNQLLPGSRPLAQDYAGHQFGQFNPFLGDGRVLLLGELEAGSGTWEICLKGAGKTPYSREFDGRAGLSGCLREMEHSQRLAELCVPTTHSLCVINGSEQVYRGGFEPAAILTRIAPSHIRFGTFENYYFQRNTRAMHDLADFVIQHHYPECNEEGEHRYSCFFRAVVIRTARLIAHWQAAGFVHGMMNTDNQSILGITLDFGAAAFTDNFDPDFVSNPEDEHGRYAFGQQPVIGLWNCNILARALSPIIPEYELKQALERYEVEHLHYLETLQEVDKKREKHPSTVTGGS